MESSEAPSWLANLEMNYYSFLEDFEQLGGILSSPTIPDAAYFSPENCLSNSSLDLNPSPVEVNIITPPQPKKNKLNAKNAKKTTKPRNKSWNSSLKKAMNDKNAEKSGKTKGKKTSNDSCTSANKRKRPRSNEAITSEEVEKKDDNSTEEAENQHEPKLKDHVTAERNRRQKLTQRFITLSSLLPGLTRMDKASVLEDAIKYVNQLQDRVKALQAQGAQKVIKSSTVGARQSESVPDECNSFTCDSNSLNNEFATKAADALPEIDIRFSDQIVLVRILCENRKGIVPKAMSAIESFGLTVTNASTVPFTEYSVDITITAKVDEEINVTPEDFVKRLNFGLKQLWM